MTQREPVIVRSRSEAELLAALPHVAGMPLRNSIVVAPFWGNRTPSALRIDLPDAPSRADDRALASIILGHLARLDGCESVAIAIYTDEPYAGAFAARCALVNHLMERIRASGYDIVAANLVAADGWGCFVDDTAERSRPLDEIEAASSRLPDDAASRAPIALPPTDPALAATVEELLLNRLVLGADVDAFGRPRRAALPDPIDHLERALRDPDRVGAQVMAHLLALIDSEGAVDRTVLQIAFGREVGADSWRRTLDVRRRAAEAGCQPMDILNLDHESDPAATELDEIGLMLTGQSSVPASAARLHAGALLLGRAIAHCPLPERSWTMCALAWVRWAMGLTNAADDLLLSAGRIDPRNSLVPVYRTIAGHFLPTWIFDGAGATRAAGNRASRRRAARSRRGHVA